MRREDHEKKEALEEAVTAFAGSRTYADFNAVMDEFGFPQDTTLRFFWTSLLGRCFACGISPDQIGAMAQRLKQVAGIPDREREEPT